MFPVTGSSCFCRKEPTGALPAENSAHVPAATSASVFFPAAPWVVCQTTVRKTEPPAWNKTKRSWRLVPAGIVVFAPVVTTQLIVIGCDGSSICVTRFGSVSVLPAGGAKPVTRLSPATSFTPVCWNVSTRPATVVVPVTVTGPAGTAPDTKNWACTEIGLFML